MRRLPLLVSLPHAGLEVPSQVADLCVLPPREIERDSDEGAAAIYTPLRDRVARFVSTDIARAIVDLNRAEDDRRKDGVVKTHTCWDVPVYRESPDEVRIEALLERYYRPYHRRLTLGAGISEVVVGVDCHTMATVGPPVGPDAGATRPLVCLSNAESACSRVWLERLGECFRRVFGTDAVLLNRPFRGGHITRRHAQELPWVQVELSRTAQLSDAAKAAGVMQALADWCHSLPVTPELEPRLA